MNELMLFSDKCNYCQYVEKALSNIEHMQSILEHIIMH